MKTRKIPMRSCVVTREKYHKQELIRVVRTCDGSVVVDEIGIKTSTTFEMEHLLNIVNRRIDLGKATIYTSNLTDIELQEKLGDRLYSRIANSTYNIEFNGQDKRYLK